MKKALILGVLVALLLGCNNASTQTTDNGATEKPATDETTVRYLDAMPADFNEDDIFAFILDYGGYDMIVETWQMPDGDWLIPYHWSEMEDGGYYEEDEAGNQTEVEYKDPFEGKPYPVIHNPHFSFSTRNYGGETINFYAAPDSDEVLCSTNWEIGLDVIAADLKTRRLLVRTNPKDWFWAKPGEEAVKLSDIAPVEGEGEFDFEEERHPFVDLKGWIDEEWVCGSTVTTCP